LGVGKNFGAEPRNMGVVSRNVHAGLRFGAVVELFANGLGADRIFWTFDRPYQW